MNRPIEDIQPQSIAQLARRAFEQIGYQQLSSLECFEEKGLLILRGRLNSFYLKQVAQSVAVKIPGVQLVQNEIEVV
jgi:osmotically-inducible protein OsmY